MLRVFARTREREKAWKLGGFATAGSLVAAPLVTLLFRGVKGSTPTEMLWTFSVILEAFCILPQLVLLRQTTVPTVIDSYYLVTLGSYRALYIVNWIYRGIKEHQADAVAIIFGVIQTAFYVDFAWVYYSRQRVKLRGGGIIDSDDLRKGFLVSRVAGTGRQSEDEDVEGDNGAGKSRHGIADRWGARGISVSADDTLQEHVPQTGSASYNHDNPNAESHTMLADDGRDDDEIFADGDDDAPQLLDATGRFSVD